MESYSDDPGLVKASAWRVMWFHPKYFLMFEILTIIFISIAWASSNLWIQILFCILAVIAQIGFMLYCKLISILFKDGDSNLGRVLRPNVYAVPANLRMSYDEPRYAAVKVMKHKIPKVIGVSGEIGTDVPTVALYNPPKSGQNHWSDLNPIPSTVGTNDPDIIRHHIDKQAHLRSELDRRLSLLCPDGNESELKPGLYLLDDEKLEALERVDI